MNDKIVKCFVCGKYILINEKDRDLCYFCINKGIIKEMNEILNDIEQIKKEITNIKNDHIEFKKSIKKIKSNLILYNV